MSKAIAFAGIFATLLILVPIVPAKCQDSQPAWLVLTRAYPSRNGRIINDYTKSSVTSVRLYAQALQALSNHDLKRLEIIGRKCAHAQPQTDADNAAYFGCLFAVSTGLGAAGHMRASFLWTAKVIEFYKAHQASIDKATGSNNPANIQGILIPDVVDVENWPRPKITLKKRWHSMKLHNGAVRAYIDGTPIMMMVDTGATAITLSRDTISRYALSSDLIPLHAHFGGLDSSNGYSAGLYYVKKLQVGPITIHNAYVSVYPGKKALLGIDVLRLLKRFSISSDKIAPITATQDSTCGKLLFTRATVTQAVQYPFFAVPTSVGKLGLFLDSGLHVRGPFRGAGVHLSPRVVSRLAIAGKLKHVKHQGLVLKQNGKRVYSTTSLFDISVAGFRTRVYAGLRDSVDPLVAGALDFSFFRKATVSYDFPNKRMCISAVKR